MSFQTEEAQRDLASIKASVYNHIQRLKTEYASNPAMVKELNTLAGSITYAGSPARVSELINGFDNSGFGLEDRMKISSSLSSTYNYAVANAGRFERDVNDSDGDGSNMDQVHAGSYQAQPPRNNPIPVPQHIKDLESGVNTRIDDVEASDLSRQAKDALIAQIKAGNPASVQDMIKYINGLEPSSGGGTPPPNDPGGGGIPDPTAAPQRGAALIDNTDFIKKVVKGYTGREATQADIDHWNARFNAGETKHDLLLEATGLKPGIPSPEHAALQGKYTGGEFDTVIDQVWQDYTGGPADETAKKIHGAALKSGMSVSDLREMMLTAPGVQAHVATNPVTADELAKQDSLMSQAIAAITTNPAQSDDVMAGAVAAAGAIVEGGAPAPEPPAPVDVAGVVDTDADRAVKAKLDSLYQRYVGRPAEDADFAIHGPALMTGAKSWATMEDELNRSNEAYVVRTMQNYYNTDNPPRDKVNEYSAQLGSNAATRQSVLIAIANDANAKQLQASYDGSKNDTVTQIWGAHFGEEAAKNLSETDKKIHGAALAGGMSANDLNDYLGNAASGGVVAFTDKR